MDTLVARYGRPAFEDEEYSQSEQQELSQTTPSLSLNFALPPLANVRYNQRSPSPLSGSLVLMLL